MPVPAPGSQQYFLGVGGQQMGPFTESQVLSQIKEGRIPRDTLIWYEGLNEWQPILSIEFFRMVFEGEASPVDSKVKATISPFRPLATDQSDSFEMDPAPQLARPRKTPKHKSTAISYAESGVPLKPVFDKRSSRGHSSALWVFLLWGLVFVSGMGLITFLAMQEDSVEAVVGEWFAQEEQNESQQPRPKAQTPSREALVKKTSDRLLLFPEESLQTLKAIATQNPDDKAGNEAISTIVDYLKGQQRFTDIGRFLVQTKRFEEAAKYFLLSPPSYLEAEAALFSAYQTSKETRRRDLLIQDILLLLGPLNNLNTAIERIRLLESDFPGEPHPFQFYLKTTEQKIADIFQRISGYFVQNLLGFITSEFPQLNLTGRPLVEIRREQSGQYRIVASFKGSVLLNQDRLEGIYFVFWLIQDNWYLVDTNLTPERTRYAKAEKAKHTQDVLTATEMLTYLQTVFRSQFPKNLLHEPVDLEAASREGKTPW